MTLEIAASAFGESEMDAERDEAQASEIQRAPGLRGRLLTRADLANLPEPEPLIGDTIDRNTLALLAGPWGSGKSFLAADWASCVATGKDWQGRETHRGKVLLIMAEGVSGMHARLGAWEYAWRHQITDMALLPIAVNLMDARHRLHLFELAAEERYDLVVVDTLSRCMVGADENSAKDVGIVVDALERLRAASSGTVLAVHHTGKDRTTVRGSSVLEAAVDTVYQLDGGDGFLKLNRTKRKNGPVYDDHLLKLKQVEESCIVEVANLSAVTADKIASARTLLTIFADTFADTGASKAELRLVAKMPNASFHRALSALVKDGDLHNHGTEQRPFYKMRGTHA